MSQQLILNIPESELEFLFSRSGGPGGQNVNKVESKVTVVFDYLKSSQLSWDDKGRIGANTQVQARLDSEGKIAISCQEFRTQVRNREIAVQKLKELLAAALYRPRKRVPTKRTKASERRRLNTKRVRSLTKSKRGKVVDDVGE